MKAILASIVMALPLMAQKKVWEVEVTPSPTMVGNVQGGVNEAEVENHIASQSISDAAGNSLVMLETKFVNENLNQYIKPILVLWIDRKGVLLRSYEFKGMSYVDTQMKLCYVSDKRCALHSMVGTYSYINDVATSGSTLIFGERGKTGITNKIVYAEMNESLTMPEITRSAVPQYFRTSFDAETKKVKVALWRVW
jgi:hypothetical protein